eukprot:SAG31_NODE_3531_length_4151_cov_2.125864_2_plen_73_part_00
MSNDANKLTAHSQPAVLYTCSCKAQKRVYEVPIHHVCSAQGSRSEIVIVDSDIHRPVPNSASDKVSGSVPNH